MSNAHVTVTDGNGTSGLVVPADGGTHFNAPTPVCSFTLKLRGLETGESIMQAG